MRFDPEDLPAKDSPYTVARLNRAARALLEGTLGSLWVEAEVSEVTRAPSGHLYFKLTDSDRQGQVDAVMWRSQAMRYGSRVAKGTRVLCRGRVTIYEKGGRYQLVADMVDEAGAGEKARRLAELRARLEAEGLFAAERKRPLPSMPRCVGVVTSRSGAAVRDIGQVASRRFPVRILLAHAAVQGDGAPAEIVAGMEILSAVEEVDVIIVGRGGGSAEDLEAFNDERVVRAIAVCPVPVVSAVGHEIDISLSDLAADRRAATPSEAAELVVPDLDNLVRAISRYRGALVASMRTTLVGSRGRLESIHGKLRTRDPRVRLRMGMESLSRARETLARWPDRTISRAKGDLMAAGEGLFRWPEPRLERARGDLGRLVGSLEALSPLASLARGYSFVRRTTDGALVRSADQAPEGTRLKVTLARGELFAVVTPEDGE